MKTQNVFVSMIFNLSFVISTFSQGVFPPAAGKPGSTAIHTDSSIIKSWATGIELYRGWVNITDTTIKYNGSTKATFGYPAIALGKAQESSFDVVSLGDGGMATLTFDRPIINGPGPDFVVFENGFSDTFLELAFVDVSSDGERFVRFPAVSLTQTTTQVGGFGALDPTNIHNLAGKYRQGYGTPFDLEDIKDSIGIDVNNIRFVRVIDVVGNIDDAYATYDAKGNKVNDPWPTPFHSCGFDLDAIGVINHGNVFQISNFNDLSLADNSYWNGSDLSGGFTSNSVFYKNTYDSVFNSWFGFSYSNMTDNVTAGYTNQYSAYTRGGMDAIETGGTNYGVAYVPIDWQGGTYEMIPLDIVFNTPSVLSGFYVTNSTYAYLSMKNGEIFAKKFGGISGNDPDYFKLLVWGEKSDGSKTDTVNFYLADFRFTDNTKDYIVDNWRWVDLQKLGVVKKIWLSLESSDVGTWGMNTPSYFCFDNLTIAFPNILQLANPIADVSVEKNASPLEINLSGVFAAYDVTGLVLSVISNSNMALVSSTITDSMLILSFTPEQTGEANIVIQGQLDSQTITDTFNVKVNPLTEIEQNFVQICDVYPNPFNTQLSVACPVGYTVMVFDVLGRKVFEEKATSNVVQFAAEELKQGHYIVNIISHANEVQTINVVKQ